MNCNKDVTKEMTISNQIKRIIKVYIRRDYMLIEMTTQHEQNSIQQHYTNSSHPLHPHTTSNTWKTTHIQNT